MSIRTDPLAPPAEQPLVSPFSSGGLVDVFRRRYLLRLLVQKEVRARYQGSVLGVLWSYIQPLVRFCMYFFVIGLLLGLHESVPNFAIHIFAALVCVHFFTETFSSGTRSIVQNKAIVRKMAMPREMFPVSSVIVSAINSFPQLLILFVGAVAVGWTFDPGALLAAVLGLAIITVFGTALALLFAGFNVFFRDFQSVVATFSMVIMWSVPMIYPFEKVANHASSNPVLYNVYLANPLAVGVLLVERAFWLPTTLGQGPKKNPYPTDIQDIGFPHLPEHLFVRGFVMLGATLVVLVICQLVFRRLEGKFADRL